MAAKKRNLITRLTRVTVVGEETPLDYVSVYHYNSSYSTEVTRVELAVDVTTGRTTNRVEVNLSPNGGKKLAKRLVSELGMTADDFGFAVPSEEG